MSYEFKAYPFEAKRYAARLPPLRNGVEARRHAVAIVGGGPVGLTLALGLARQGVASVLIEADDSVCYGSRAICISRRSLEIIERLGAVQPFLDKGLPWTGGTSFYRETEVLRFEMPHDENQKLPAMVNIEQFYIEQFLLDAAEKLPDLIDIRWSARVTGVKQDEAGATLDISTDQGDYRLETDWLVACDGGRSVVRDALGLQLQGTSYEGRYVIADILMKSDRPTGRLAWFDPPSNPGSTILVHKQPDDVWRIDYQLDDDEDADEAVKPENVIPRVQSHLEMMGETGPWSPIWITLYRAHCLTLDSYRHGRTMFAGDAAHLVPIFGVRGANSGIDDADNLGWKLAFVVKGLASDRLLDSFSAERVFATRENLSQGMKSTEFMAPPTFAFAMMRKAVLSLAEKHAEIRSLINPRQSAAITYSASPLNAGSDAFAAGPVPGEVLTQCPLAVHDGPAARPGYLTDLLGRGFTALWFGDGQPPPDDLVALKPAFADRGVDFDVVTLSRGPAGSDPTGRLFDLYGAAPGALYLVRPDGHVLGRWLRADARMVKVAIDRVLNP